MEVTKQLLERLRKLHELQTELHRKYIDDMGAIAREVETLMGGGLGIADVLKRLEKHYDATWCVRYAPGQTGRYVWNYGKDRAQWKRLISLLGVEELELRVVNYLRDGDDYYVKSRHPFALFITNVNRFASSSTSTPALELEAPVVADCKHKPPCKSDQEHTRRRVDEMKRPA